jgi:uncharacterized membrane protein
LAAGTFGAELSIVVTAIARQRLEAVVFELLFSHPLWAYRTGTFAWASGWPRWLLALAIAIGCALIAVGLWRRRSLGAGRLVALGSLQSLLLALLLALVWRPVLNVERVRERENVLAIAIDASASMRSTDMTARSDAANAAPLTRLQLALNGLQGGTLESLRKTFDVRMFGFATDTALWSDALSGEGSALGLHEPPAENAAIAQTRIGDALTQILKTAGTAPLAAVVLMSDGAENGGSLSEDRLAELVSYGVPIHTVGIGAERIPNDLELTNVRVPHTAAQDATVTAEVTVRANQAANVAGKTRLRVYDREALIASREVELPKDVSLTTFNVEFPAGETGVHELRFTLDPLPEERELINNSRQAVLTVPATRRSVLYLEGEPRWEFKFIRRALEGDRALRLVSVVRTTPNKYYRQGVNSAEELASGFPTQAAELFAYDALILGSYEASTLNPAQHQMLKDFVDKRGGSILLLAGRDGIGEGGWRNAPLAQALPTQLPEKSGAFMQKTLRAKLTNYGAESAVLRLDTDLQRNVESWQTLPELANYQMLGRLKPGAVVLLEGQVTNKGVATREHHPLLVWQRYGRGSTYLLATASTQRWQMSLPPEDQRHETFWRQLAHALADNALQPASVRAERSVYADERRIAFDAELREPNFAPINRAQVEARITPERGAAFMHTMQASGSSDGRYSAAFDASAPGLYRIDVLDKAGATAATTFVRRQDNVIEHFGREQHRAVLERIARMTGGRYWTLDELSGLTAAIPYTKAGIIERQMLDLWNIPFVFLVLLALKLGEWGLRLKWGRL